MADRVLTLRELNRATLARQMLLARADLSVPAAIERLVGLQAQAPRGPYVGLWTRLAGFERDTLAELIEQHAVVKATLMRGTLHLVTAANYLWLRSTLQPMLTAGWQAVVRDRGAGVDVPDVIEAARAYLAAAPRTFAALSAMLSERQPKRDVGAMRYAVRTHLPLVQVPTAKRWSYPGNPSFTLAEGWLGQALPAEERLEELIRRYLAAFGPATVADLQTWSGLPRLKAAVEALRPGLVSLRDERRRELFDLPDAPRPDGDEPAPPRFLPEYDNLLLSHQDRTRVVATEHRKQVYLPALRVATTFLVDGFVAGTWAVERAKESASLTITPFAPLSDDARAALAAEGERLVRFVEPDAATHAVQFAK